MRAVGSPVPDDEAAKMTDEQWLAAIAQYDRDDERIRDGGQIQGGAIELSRLLQRQAEKQAGRFVQLLLRFPTNTNPHYFEAVLDGVAKAALDLDVLLDPVRRCHKLPGRPCGLSICRLVRECYRLPWPQEAVETIVWYATEDPDPKEDRPRMLDGEGDRDLDFAIMTDGINSVRGVAAEALGALILADGSRLRCLRPTLERLVADPSIAVRACVGETLTYALNHDRDLAVQLFLSLCAADDELLATGHVDRFLFYAQRTHYADLSPLIQRMIESELPEAQRAGARRACLSALAEAAAVHLADRCMKGTEAHRLGVAEVVSANVTNAQFGRFCENRLIALFSDCSQDVRVEAAGCFRQFQGDELGAHVSLVEAFVDSTAFAHEHDDLVRALDETTAKLPEVTCFVCGRFLDSVGRETGSIQAAASAHADTVCNLIVRVYSQNTGQPEIQSRCLDLVDQMTDLGVYGYEAALSSLDR